MAIRKRAGRAKPYQVYWNNPFTDKRETQSFETEEEALKADSLIKHRLKFERESFRPNNEPKATQDVLTLEAVYIMYLKEKQFTQHNLANQLSAFRPIFQLIGQTDLVEIDNATLVRVKECMLQQVSPATAHRRLTNLRALLNWAAEKGYCRIPHFPKMPSVQYKRFVPPSPEELSAIMKVAPDHIQRVVVLGAQCGVRVGTCELFKLTWEDVNMTHGILRVHGAKKNLNSPWREVPIRESLLPLFRAWHNADTANGVEHLIHYEGKPVKSIKRAWAASLRMAGITRRIRPYDLRHAFATELIAAGADIGTVAKLMGHSGPAMLLAHYQFVMDRQKKAAVEALPDLVNVPKTMCPKKEVTTNLQ